MHRPDPHHRANATCSMYSASTSITTTFTAHTEAWPNNLQMGGLSSEARHQAWSRLGTATCGVFARRASVAWDLILIETGGDGSRAGGGECGEVERLSMGK